MLPVSALEIKNKLVNEGLVAPEKFDEISEEAERLGQDVADILVSRGIVSRDYINNVVASMLGVEIVNLGGRALDENIVRLLSEEMSRKYEAAVFQKEDDGTLDVAMVNPADLEAVEFLSQRLNAKIKPFLAAAEDLNRVFAVYGAGSTADFKKSIEENMQAALGERGKSIEEAAADLPIVSIVDNIISYAISLRASDIHVEATEEKTMVRFRIDGVLYEMVDMPKAVHPILVARLKILSSLRIDEHRKPQDGRFRYKLANQVIDVRVAVMPTYYGEKVEMRLLDAAQKPLSFEDLGMLPRTAELVREGLKKSYGMILACGPTGSGKTTTLYSMLSILNKPGVNIVTIEDPIEYNIRYVNQSQVNPQAGITFSSALRAFLRQDPNVILVGEIRDIETADIGVQAALTGHLILSSVHTNDAPTVVPRLIDLKIPPFLVSATLVLVIAQRLVRKICLSCIYSYEAAEEAIATIKNQLKEMGINEKGVRIPKTFYAGKGCSVCNHSGYKGRIGVFEILNVSDKIRQVIDKPGFTLESLVSEAREEGFKTMFEDGLEKIELGMTTLEEVIRVIRE